MKSALIGLLLVAGCRAPEPQPEQHVVEVRHDSPRPNLIRVEDCHGGMKHIYADSGMTIAMPNPLVTDVDGKFSFFADGCIYAAPEKMPTE